MTRAIVVMGPSGNGKSTLGRLIAERLGLPFIEGDDQHPPENIAKMARGEALTDADRAPFLDAIGAALKAHPEGAVATCSALKRAYRDRLRHIAGDILFVLARLDRAELERRLSARKDHFMPASLLDSQLATLEEPQADEHCILLDGRLSPEEQAAAFLAAWNGRGSAPAKAGAQGG